MAKIFVLLVVSALMLDLSGGEDYYWKPNSNWNNPSNWALGRVPSCGDNVSLSAVPSKSVIYLDTDTTVKSISLPANGRIVFGSSVTIRLSQDTECTVPGDTKPMAAPIVKNEFVGATNNYWECSQNWLLKDNVLAKHPPCGGDRALFEQGSFSFVQANDSIFVQSMSLRGQEVQSQSDLDPFQFNIKLEINSACKGDPSSCPCPNNAKCPKGAGGGARQTGSSTSGGVAAGVVFGVMMVVAVIVVLVLLSVILYKRYRTRIHYVKDDLLDEDASAVPADNNDNLCQNPVFSPLDDKVELGYETKPSSSLEDIPLPPVVGNEYESVEVKTVDDEDKHTPKLNKYERFQ